MKKVNARSLSQTTTQESLDNIMGHLVMKLHFLLAHQIIAFDEFYSFFPF